MPDQLYRLTIGEVKKLYEGWETDHMNQWRMAAFVSANIMNLFTKKAYTVDKLLGINSKKSKRKTAEQIAVDRDYLKGKFE